jgi:hypothetical protein
MSSVIAFFKKHPLSTLLLIHFIYCLALIWRSSFVWNHLRYFVLFDDEMISMKYAFNLAHGAGLVWNAGKIPVEGYTNFFWTILMAGFHLLPVPLEKMSLFIQVFAAFLSSLTILFVFKITHLLTKKFLPSFLAAIFTAFYFPLNNWSAVLGTEVSLLSLIIVLCTYISLSINRKGEWRKVLLVFFLLGLGTLTRMDFFLPAGILTIFLLTNKFVSKHEWGRGVVLMLLMVGAHVAFRLSYYHDLFPNTYYLKMTGYPVLLRLTRGFYVAVKNHNLILLLIPFVYAFFVRTRATLLLFFLVLGQFLYSIYVGGDAWEGFGETNRYNAVTTALYFCLLFSALWQGYLFIKTHSHRSFKKLFRPITAVGLVFLFILFNTQSDNMPLEMTLLKAPLTVGENQMQVRIATVLNHSVKDPSARIGVVWAGSIPYFSKGEFIDLLGKNDTIIAHEVAKNPYGVELGPLQKLFGFWPGHNKFDYPYILNAYQPDLISQLYPREFMPLLTNYIRFITPEGHEMFIRKDSKKVIIPDNSTLTFPPFDPKQLVL